MGGGGGGGGGGRVKNFKSCVLVYNGKATIALDIV